jgi:hypothetical protein
LRRDVRDQAWSGLFLGAIGWQHGDGQHEHGVQIDREVALVAVEALRLRGWTSITWSLDAQIQA